MRFFFSLVTLLLSSSCWQGHDSNEELLGIDQLKHNFEKETGATTISAPTNGKWQTVSRVRLPNFEGASATITYKGKSVTPNVKAGKDYILIVIGLYNPTTSELKCLVLKKPCESSF